MRWNNPTTRLRQYLLVCCILVLLPLLSVWNPCEWHLHLQLKWCRHDAEAFYFDCVFVNLKFIWLLYGDLCWTFPKNCSRCAKPSNLQKRWKSLRPPTQWCRSWGCKHNPKSFDLSKFWTKPQNILANISTFINNIHEIWLLCHWAGYK